MDNRINNIRNGKEDNNRPSKSGVTGSSPVGPTSFKGVSVADATPCTSPDGCRGCLNAGITLAGRDPRNDPRPGDVFAGPFLDFGGEVHQLKTRISKVRAGTNGATDAVIVEMVRLIRGADWRDAAVSGRWVPLADFTFVIGSAEVIHAVE